MTVFVIVCAAMLAAALLWITLPLLRTRHTQHEAETEAEPTTEEASANDATRGRGWSAAVAVCVSVIAVAMYAALSNWNWQAVQTAEQNQANVENMLTQLEKKLEQNPQDTTGWLLLGRSYATLERYARSADAYQRAYDLTGGDNIEAAVGLAEALVMVDETSLNGRAGKLFEQALAKAPDNPKALWYAAVAALRAGSLPQARERLQRLLTQNPPPELRSVLERQIQDLDQQLAQAGSQAPANGAPGSAPAATAGVVGAATSAGPAQGSGQPAASSSARIIRASVTIAPEIQKQLRGPLTLFVLARDPAAPGPPLAVQRRNSSEIPLTVELSERDAMMPSHSIANASRVEVVARLSQSGTPQARSGDFFGSADYDFGKDTGTLRIVIDRTVP